MLFPMGKIARRSGCPAELERRKSTSSTIQLQVATREDRSLATLGSAARRWTVIASGLLILALALIVIYTRPNDFLSPVALVVVAAIGLAALLLQLRFRQDMPRIHPPLWLNIIGLVCAICAIAADVLRMSRRMLELVSFAALVCFGVSGSLILRALRRRKQQPE
jgi:hypothetical protein